MKKMQRDDFKGRVERYPSGQWENAGGGIEG